MWATTPRGLLRWDPKTRRLQQFNERDGLSDAEFTGRPPAVNADGRVLAVTQTGLVAFDVNADDTVLPASSLVIAEVRVRRDDARGWQPLPLTGTLLLGPDDRDLQIDARLLSYASPQGNRYRFRVRGYDQDWVEQGGDGQRTLSRLPTGSYLIEVQAATARAWTPSQQLQVKVLPPWWRSGMAIFGLHPAGVVAAGDPGLVDPGAAASPAVAVDGAQATAGRTGLAGQEPFPGHAGP